jgi:hypothetical protein
MAVQTLCHWRDNTRKKGLPVPGKTLTTNDWSAEAKFAVLIETAPMSEAEMSQYCREKACFANQLSSGNSIFWLVFKPLKYKLKPPLYWCSEKSSMRYWGATAFRPEPANKLKEHEREQIVAVCNEPEYAGLPPSQIALTLLGKGIYIASESSFYRVLNANDQLKRYRRDVWIILIALCLVILILSKVSKYLD